MSSHANKQTLHHSLGAWSWVWLSALVLALGLQIAGLLLPFLRIAVFIAGGADYSLLHTVSLLWEGKVYVLVVLITGFSIVFPFVKILLLAWTWLILPSGPRRTHVIEWLGVLGKWSMLDPLSVLILVLLATDQWAVSTTMYVGVYCFLIAIALTMCLSIVASALDAHGVQERAEQPQRRQALVRRTGSLGPIAIAVLVLALGLFVTALTQPFLQVNQFLLHASAYAVGSVTNTMIHDHNWALAILSAVGLVTMPALTLAAEAWAWIVPATPHVHRRRWRWINWIREWCMLDVLALGLGLFIMEGQGIIRVEVRVGLWMLLATAVTLWLSGWLGTRAAMIGIRRMDQDA
ncbi:MAG: paraquat-inducible protein A [Planctomycetes bacterium]|nr:paraquat-inducible protein A [Planctomycetota bacterium]